MVHGLVRFGECELDFGCFCLRRNGVVQKVEPRVFDLVAYLVQHSDRVVPKRELFTSIWAGAVVSESALTQCVFAARRVLGDSGQEQRVIATVSKRGYRFVAPVES